jgi:glycosyltransferase involved in cell wall biosynthesis
MKIGFFCQEYPPRPHGGIGTFVKTLADELHRLGHEVTVVEFGEHPGERSENLARVVTLPQSHVPKVAWLINRWRLRSWLRRAVRSGEIEIFELPDFQGWLPFPGELCPVVVRLHLADSILTRDGGDPVSLVLRLCEYLTLRNNTAWIGVSRYILNRTRAFFRLEPRQASVIYNPVTIGELPPHTKPCRPFSWPYVLYVGSISERKGALTLAHAASKLMDREEKVCIVYVGAETDYRGKPISEEIRRIVGHKHRARLLFTGWLPRDQVRQWMYHAAAVALPSRLEAFALVPLEAMALKVPVVYTKVGPGPELITDGVDGLLVEPDDAASLTRLLTRLLADREYAQRLAEAGQNRALGTFDLDSCVRGTLALYQNLSAAGP